jgi:CHAD domain-containing protein
MRQQRYEVESLGPVITAIEKREKKLKAIRSSVGQDDRKRLDLRLQALQESRQILSNACKTAPKMNAFFDGAPED